VSKIFSDDVTESAVFDIHDFDRYPHVLMQEVIKFIKGEEIHFARDDKGKLLEINGITNNQLKSHCQFIHDNQTTSIHCFSNNCDDMIISTNNLKFGNFHFYPLGQEIHCIQDEFDLFPGDGKIENQHNYFKIFTNDSGMIVKVDNNHKVIYEAEYSADNRLLYQNAYGIETKFEYDAGIILTKMQQIDNVLIEKSRFEYSNNRIEQVYDITNSTGQLKTVHNYSHTDSGHLNINLIGDGVKRRYFNKNGSLVAKICLPLENPKDLTDFVLPSLHDIPVTFKTVELVVIDEESKNIRIIKKENGQIQLDQTGFYNNGLLTKIINHKDSINSTCLFSLFRSRHWTDLTEFDDGVL
jgi:hypothetical protein